MITTVDQLPNEALDAAVKAYETLMLDIASRESLGISIIAALNAWPGVTGACRSTAQRLWIPQGHFDNADEEGIILPLPPETK